MSRYRIGLFCNKKGKLSTVYVTAENVPLPYERSRVGDSPILFGKTYKGMTYAEARAQLFVDAAAAGIAQEGSSATPRPKTSPKPRPKTSPKQATASATTAKLRTPKRPAGVVLDWNKYLWSLLKANGLSRVSLQRTRRRSSITEEDGQQNLEDAILRLSGLLALVGTPQDEDARRLYGAIGCLFFNRHRTARWQKAIEQLPPERDSLMLLAAHVRAYDTEVRNSQLKDGKYKLDEVLAVMLQIREPVVYLRHASAGGLTHPGALYHQNTLRVAQENLPGALGRRAESASRNAAHLKRKVRIVGG